MPIKGLSDRKRLIRVGKIHLGIKAQGQRGQYPKAVDYFVVHASATTPEASAAAFLAVYGDQPRELDIIFPTDDITQWADPWYRAYSQSYGLICKGDGVEATARWDNAGQGPRPEGVEQGSWASASTKEFQSQKIPCMAEDCPMQKTKPPRCKAVMNLQFLLPNVRGIGCWQIDTGSHNSIRNLQDGIELIKSATGGRIRGLWLKLRLSPKEVTPPDGGTKTKTVWVLDLSMPTVSLEELMATAAKLPKDRLLAAPELDEEEPPEDLGLPAPEEEDSSLCKTCKGTGLIEWGSDEEPPIGETMPCPDCAFDPETGEILENRATIAPSPLELHLARTPDHDASKCDDCRRYSAMAVPPTVLPFEGLEPERSHDA